MVMDESQVYREILMGARCPQEILAQSGLSQSAQRRVAEAARRQQAFEERSRNVERSASLLDPSDQSLEARAMREAAASAREHLAALHLERAERAREESNAWARLSAKEFETRDEHYRRAHELRLAGDAKGAGLAQLAGQESQRLARQMQADQITAAGQIAANERLAEEYLAANRRYERGQR